MNLNEKYFYKKYKKYKKKYLQTKSELKLFPYKEIDYNKIYGNLFPEKKFLLYLRRKTDNLLINPKDNLKVWDAKIPNGLAYWFRLYPWGAHFTEGRNVLLYNKKCHKLFPPYKNSKGCTFLEFFESKKKSRDLVKSLKIKVPKEISFSFNKLFSKEFNNIIKSWSKEGIHFVLKPNSLALSEGVLIVNYYDGIWNFNAPPSSLTKHWDEKFSTTKSLKKIRQYSKFTNNAYDIAKYWCKLYNHVKKNDWIVQELLPRTEEFGLEPIEIKAYFLGGYVWYAPVSVLRANGNAIKHPCFYREENKSWVAEKLPEDTLILVNGKDKKINPKLNIKITNKLGEIVAKQIALNTENIAKKINCKFMMRADFFVVPKNNIKYTKNGPIWSINELSRSSSDFDIYFNEMQHWYGKSLFMTNNNKFLYSRFQRTANRLLEIDNLKI